ncbi:MAG: sigma-70 family RNA polymerase sigma factor [Oscillospiraceae bacterium]|nr:sigma-70 family RNA polymerase sigma factor [Oscillospiraceae bacterium]
MKRVPFEVLEFDSKIIEAWRNENAYDNSGQIAKIKRALAEVIKNDLTPRQKELITMYYYDGENIPAIANSLEINRSTVSRTLARARKNISDRLKYLM